MVCSNFGHFVAVCNEERSEAGRSVDTGVQNHLDFHRTSVPRPLVVFAIGSDGCVYRAINSFHRISLGVVTRVQPVRDLEVVNKFFVGGSRMNWIVVVAAGSSEVVGVVVGSLLARVVDFDCSGSGFGLVEQVDLRR